MSELCLADPLASTASPGDAAIRRLMPDDYLDEPQGLPALQLVWVPELQQFAIVRFYAEKSGATAMVPLDYLHEHGAARRRLAMLRRILGRALEQDLVPAPTRAAS